MSIVLEKKNTQKQKLAQEKNRAGKWFRVNISKTCNYLGFLLYSIGAVSFGPGKTSDKV
jgi:hypothetical protein